MSINSPEKGIEKKIQINLTHVTSCSQPDMYKLSWEHSSTFQSLYIEGVIVDTCLNVCRCGFLWAEWNTLCSTELKMIDFHFAAKKLHKEMNQSLHVNQVRDIKLTFKTQVFLWKQIQKKRNFFNFQHFFKHFFQPL